MNFPFGRGGLVPRSRVGAIRKLEEEADWHRFSAFDLPLAGSCRAGMMDFSGGFKFLQMISDTIKGNI